MKRKSLFPGTISFRFSAASVFLVTVYFLLLRNTASAELWGLLSFGAALKGMGFPSVEIFSYTAGSGGWAYPNWGAGALFYELLSEWGDASLFALKALLFGATLGIAAAICRAASDRPAADGAFFLLGLLSCRIFLEFYSPTINPAAFSVLGYLAFLWILDAYRRDPATRAPWLLPPLAAAWINVDNGVVWGLFALAVHAAWFTFERRSKQAAELAIIAVFGLGASMVNPYGWSYLGAVALLGTGPNVFGSGQGYAWTYAALACATLAAIGVNCRRDRRFPGEFLLAGAPAAAGWLHVERAPLFAFAMLALGAPEIARLAEFYAIPARMRSLFGVLLPAGVGAAAATLILLQLATAEGALHPRVPGWNAVLSRPDATDFYPLGAVSFLADAPGEVRLWCPPAWCGFASWSLYPKAQVSWETPYERSYPEPVRADHESFWGPNHDVAAAAKYETTHVLVPAGDQPVSRALEAAGWLRVYADPLAAVYARGEAGAPQAARSNDSRYVGELLGNLSRFSHLPPALPR